MTLLDEIADIDPRIEARRREVAHAGYRRRRRWWVLVLVLAVASVGGWLWARSALLEVDQGPPPVVQRVPVAVIAAPDGSPLGVDIDGFVIGPPTGGEQLVAIGGLGQATAGSQLPPASAGPLAVAAALRPEMLTRINGIVPGDGDQVVIHMNPSGEVLFGPPTEVETKVRSLATVFDQVVEDCLATVDVRVAHQVAVTRDAACGSPSPSQP